MVGRGSKNYGNLICKYVSYLQFCPLIPLPTLSQTPLQQKIFPCPSIFVRSFWINVGVYCGEYVRIDVYTITISNVLALQESE